MAAAFSRTSMVARTVVVATLQIAAASASSFAPMQLLAGWHEVDTTLKEPYLSHSLDDTSALCWDSGVGCADAARGAKIPATHDLGLHNGSSCMQASTEPASAGLRIFDEGIISEEEAKLVWLDLLVRRRPLPGTVPDPEAQQQSARDAGNRRRELQPMKASFVQAEGGRSLQLEAPRGHLVGSLREVMTASNNLAAVAHLGL
eukprot:TRINITY_DN7761_c0_g1_i1.p1 TRINITY_DN7761_c0_g1~~TRINITY_DN7761_c0_g1_i1.p1  ORF type:complete len:203 (+),score=45.23 TRINITY_DN7761_c0_g1_i1:118-726(+)